MALKTDWKIGEKTYSDCYVKVVSLDGNKKYINGAALVIDQESNEPVYDYRFMFTPSADDNSVRWDKQAYEYLKTLPEFKNAVDVLEEGQSNV